MEKTPYSVEWLSESSLGKPVYTKTEHTFGYSGLQFNKDCRTSLSSRPGNLRSSANSTEKENDGLSNVLNGRISVAAQIKTRPSLQEPEISRKVLREMQPTDQATNMTDSSKKSPSLSDEENVSRARTKFTPEQLKELERSFKENMYIGSSEKRRLSKVLKLSECQIKTWFQNRRMKLKRQSQDARVDAFFSSLYMPCYSYTGHSTSTYSVRAEFPALVPPPMASTVPPFGCIYSTVTPGVCQPALPSTSPGSNLCSSMPVHSLLRARQRYNPY
ncbi:hypothetical protein XENTR_v10018049 [Xenopus tropicalis]|uniref:Homeobox protein vex1 n=1 Tax=Xenopus tropicalis TaxID=8364 RepID=B0BMD2_XENTR|nr:VENT homeobox 3 gene 1 [Xenopus tropicalis]AAI58380.1 ventx3.1 protein [Xenopus tropicalis]KAE8590404.1 hypothetical protein XENTR_v10018049 [Xenopus tropicalis]|eukprot:NP_001107738.1 VENT homeobox 3, gene 1 [Xenopus tropicalis]